mmetsp:Transcript_3605/g.12759  ORF Transcript_3605/g.12759 Transcript_3605/m.12759 type:complete len:295 (+) Transcript_3605:867-1751(+)
MPRKLVVAVAAGRLRGVHEMPQRRQARALDRERACGRGHLVGELLRAGGVAAVLRHDDARAVAARVVSDDSFERPLDRVCARVADHKEHRVGPERQGRGAQRRAAAALGRLLRDVRDGASSRGRPSSFGEVARRRRWSLVRHLSAERRLCSGCAPGAGGVEVASHSRDLVLHGVHGRGVAAARTRERLGAAREPRDGGAERCERALDAPRRFDRRAAALRGLQLVGCAPEEALLARARRRGPGGVLDVVEADVEADEERSGAEHGHLEAPHEMHAGSAKVVARRRSAGPRGSVD